MANLTFIPNSKPSSSNEIALEDIPEEIKTDVEQTYELLKTNPGRVSASFPSLGELNKYMALVKAYCKVRPAGPLYCRKSPTRNLPVGTVEFRITELETEAEAVTNGIRDAVDKVKDAAKK